jgi:mRNA interferase MazF
MPTFERGTVIRVPFPYTDRDTRERRPALIVSDGPIGDEGSLLWILMITSAENRPWPGDVTINSPAGRSGLPVPSVIRTSKIATIEVRHADTLGSVGKSTLRAVDAVLSSNLGLSMPTT